MTESNSAPSSDPGARDNGLGSFAYKLLRDYGIDDQAIAQLIEQLRAIVSATRFSVVGLDVDCSIHPGEDDIQAAHELRPGYAPDQSNVASYVIYVLLDETRHGPTWQFLKRIASRFGEGGAKRRSTKAVQAFLALLAAYAEQSGDIQAVELLRTWVERSDRRNANLAIEGLRMQLSRMIGSKEPAVTDEQLCAFAGTYRQQQPDDKRLLKAAAQALDISEKTVRRRLRALKLLPPRTR